MPLARDRIRGPSDIGSAATAESSSPSEAALSRDASMPADQAIGSVGDVHAASREVLRRQQGMEAGNRQLFSLKRQDGARQLHSTPPPELQPQTPRSHEF